MPGLKFDANTAAFVALSINLGAYSIEIIRAGLEAIPRSQIEAGQSLGLSGVQVFRYVIVFPALKLMYPALASQFVLLMLATSVVSQISAQDLFHAASIIQSRTFRDFEVYIVGGRGLPRAGHDLPPAVRRPLPARVRPPMIRR